MELIGKFFETNSDVPAQPTNTTIIAIAKGPAHFAGAAYCPSRKGTMNWNCSVHCSVPETQGTIVHSNFRDDFSGTYGSITYQLSKNVVTVAFRGTQSDNSILTDIRTAPFPLKGFSGITSDTEAAVHDGFQSAYLAVQKDILNGIQQVMHRYPHFSIQFVGHSLGAATSQLAALDTYTALNYKSKISQFSFHGPRVGNQAYSELLKFPIYRFTHSDDIISRVPPPVLGFRHPNTPEYWENDFKFYTCTDQESSNCNNKSPFPVFDPETHNVFAGNNFVIKGC